MPGASGYLLDTGVVLLATRPDGQASATIGAQFGLRDARTRPAICEVTIGEILAFATSWENKRQETLKRVLEQLVVIAIAEPGIHEYWAALHSHAKANGLGIQNAHNDLWIAATAHVSGLTLLSTDAAAYKPLRGTSWLDVVLLDPRTGIALP